jgi:hypothetical protein
MPLARFILLSCLTITGSTLILSSCAPNKQPEAQASAAAVAPRVVGEVAVVDEEKRFVLIDLESNLYVPAPGAALRAINAKGGIAHLKASPEQKRPFVAADIVDGDPAVGDEVVR